MKPKRLAAIIIILLTGITFTVFRFPVSDKMVDVTSRIDKINKRVPNINYGGCGYFALYLHDYLNEKGIQNEIIFLSFTRQVPRHIVVKVGSSYIDNNCHWSKLSMMLFSDKDMKPHSREELVYLLHNRDWNKKFNINDTITIKKLLYE